MSAMSDYLKDKPKLAGWIGTDEDDLLIAYANDLRDSLTDLMGLYVPDNEQSPTCNYHLAVEKFQRRVSAIGKKGGAA